MQLAPAVGVVNESVAAPLSPAGTAKETLKESHTPSWIVPVVVNCCSTHTVAPATLTSTTSWLLLPDHEPPDAWKERVNVSPASKPEMVWLMPPRLVDELQLALMW